MKANTKAPKRRGGIALLIVVVGILIFSYPFYVNALNGFLDDWQQQQYAREAATQRKKQERKMGQHNQKIAKDGLQTGVDPFRGEASDERTRGYLAEHFLGTVTIPKLRSTVNLFDRTTAWLLERGASVVPGTSMPTGQKNTHALLSAHSGLPQRQLFTGLDRLEHGDTFVLTIQGKKRAYRIFRRQVVLPNKQNTIQLSEKEERVTLMTCTPYMINSHRLLLTGRRVPLTPAIKRSVNAAQGWRWLVWWGWASFILLLAALLIIVGHRWYRQRKQPVQSIHSPTPRYVKVDSSQVGG
ncbi:MAG: class C sortase [Schleiferilactobacillus harbinensis]|jgi:sortase A|nr:class C sortase [Schleiferilactobacillus harbinensis]